MDPRSFIARAEAQQWLVIAEKLLIGRDFLGSKTFAIRARESDPRLEDADQILAVSDTLLAAEKRVANNQPDWYAILQLVPLTHDSELIAGQYRQLALLLNPHKNRLPFADQAFQFVSDAWSVLSNPIRKSLYDSELNFPQQQQHNFFLQPNPIGLGSEQDQQEPQFQNNPQQQQHNFLSQSNPIGLDREHEPQVRQRRNKPQLQQQPKPPSQPQEQPPQPPPQPQLQPQQQSQPPRPRSLPPPTQKQNSAKPSPGRRNKKKEREMNTINGNASSRFWTACPFCYNMYEYPRVYAECSLRCQNCRRAFQAVVIPSPPPTTDGKEAYFCCWGFFPLGVSMSNLDKNKGKGSSWNPFSAMFPAPQMRDTQDAAYLGARKNSFVRKSSAPRLYIDDEEMSVEMSEPSEDSDVEWGSTRKKKKTK